MIPFPIDIEYWDYQGEQVIELSSRVEKNQVSQFYKDVRIYLVEYGFEVSDKYTSKTSFALRQLKSILGFPNGETQM